MSRHELDERVLAWIGEGALAPADDERFERLALDLFRFQHAHNPAYARICAAFGVEADHVRRWQEIPAVPTGAFKEARLACFPTSGEVRAFRSSGTTVERPGVLHLDTLRLYEASLRATFGAWICPERSADPTSAERIRFAVLAPSGGEAPESSLSWMFEIAVRELGTSDSTFYADPEGWQVDRVIDDLCSASEPVAVVGTAFAFVHLLDAFAARGLRASLPAGSRAMETGGFKGRSREVGRDELYAEISGRLGLPEARIVNQYGMCELASQFYEPSLRTGVATRTKRVPPWVRVRVLDPETLAEVAPGQDGLLTIYDLANTGSVLAVQTSDVGHALSDGFRVLGRLTGAEAKGCSIAADAALGGR